MYIHIGEPYDPTGGLALVAGTNGVTVVRIATPAAMEIADPFTAVPPQETSREE